VSWAPHQLLCRSTTDRLDKDMHALLTAIQSRADVTSVASLTKMAEQLAMSLRALQVRGRGPRVRSSASCSHCCMLTARAGQLFADAGAGSDAAAAYRGRARVATPPRRSTAA
jgi:hypothetical protein